MATVEQEPQHMKALRRANEIRLARAAIKRQVAQREISAADVLLAMPAECHSMPIAELLGAQRRWGVTRVAKFCAEQGLPETKTLCSLTGRQRGILIKELGVRHAREVLLDDVAEWLGRYTAGARAGVIAEWLNMTGHEAAGLLRSLRDSGRARLEDGLWYAT